MDTIEFDCETTGLERTSLPVGFALGTPKGTQYLPFGHRGGQNLDEAVVKRWAERELRGKYIRNLNTKSDLHWMRRWGVDLREQDNTFHDVAHAAALLDDHRKTFNLNELATTELGEGKADLDPDTIAALSGGQVAAYACNDVRLVRLLAEVYAPRLKAEGLEVVSRLEDAVIPTVVEMEANGMPLDVELLTKWQKSAAALEDTLQWELYRLTGFMVNPDAPTDMAKLFSRCGAQPGFTVKGKPSFTTDIVEAAAVAHPAIRIAWRLGKIRDLRNKYLDKYAAEHVDGVLYPSLNQLRGDDGGTVSGRFSCVRPNLQQVLGADKHRRAYGWVTEYGPDDYLIKRLFVPTSGRWVSADMKQCEYRIFVHYTRSERLLKKYRDDPNTNFHNYVNEDILKNAFDKTRVKVFNFLSIFGGGASAAARNLGVSQHVAEDWSRLYHAAFPEARALLNEAMDAADRRGYVKTLLGRRSRFKGERGKRERLHKALNAVVQGTAADAMKATLVALYEARESIGITMRLCVHDSMEAEVRDVEGYTALLNAQRLNLTVPLLWEIVSHSRWAA